MKKSHDDLIQLIYSLPALSQDGEAYFAMLVDVGMQYLVEASNFWRCNGVFLCSFEWEWDLWISIEGSLWVGNDFDMYFCEIVLMREWNNNIIYLVLIIFLNILLHSLLSGLHVRIILILHLFLGLFSLGLKILQHFFVIK